MDQTSRQTSTAHPADGTESFAKPDPIETPSALREHYRFMREIGHGTQGKIFLAERTSDHLPVAIKQLNIESVSNWKSYTLFEREAAVLSSLNIRGVAHFYEAFECLNDNPPCSYIVQEYISGDSLARYLQAGHRFALDRVYDIILQLLEILEQLQNHEPPVIHRDIKPSNILLKPLGGDDFEVFLIDFGAVANPQVQGGGSTVAGTFGYMAPEQLMGRPCPASDIYSLAAVIVYLITGRSPADMPVKDFHLIFEPDMQNMPPALVTTLRRMLDPDTGRRLCDIAVLKDLFTAFANSIYSSSKAFSVSGLSDSDFEARLSQVSDYGQDGNVELWQRLPDKTPRRYPECLAAPPMHPPIEECVFIHGDGYQQNQRRRGIYEREGNFKSPIRNPSGFIMFILVVPAFICPFLYLILSTFQSRTTNTLMDMLNAYLIAVVIMILITIAMYVHHGIKMHTRTKRMTNAWRNSGNALENAKEFASDYQPINLSSMLGNTLPITVESGKTPSLRPLQYLLTNGRKTIATVTGIQYVSMSYNHVESQYHYWQKQESSKKGERVCTLSCHGRPCFVISYKFNPPDDSREEDLIHKVVTYTDCERCLKPGDPLPILYVILKPMTEATSQREDLETWHTCGFERVVSMPFPYPLEDPLLLNDMIFCETYVPPLFEAAPLQRSREPLRDTYRPQIDAESVEKAIQMANDKRETRISDHSIARNRRARAKLNHAQQSTDDLLMQLLKR